MSSGSKLHTYQNTHNSSFNHPYLACNQCLKTLSYITSNLFQQKLYQWDPILLEKETWKNIESYLLFCLSIGLCMVKQCDNNTF